jgi:hypothetical protein
LEEEIEEEKEKKKEEGNSGCNGVGNIDMVIKNIRR